MRYVPALVLDAVLVVIFAVIGRASHQENPWGFAATAWPFLLALLIGHAVAALLPARPRQPWSIQWGGVVWATTAVVGLLVRVWTGNTAQTPFIVVTVLTLALFLVGWRAAAGVIRRSRARSLQATEAGDDAPLVPDDDPSASSEA